MKKIQIFNNRQIIIHNDKIYLLDFTRRFRINPEIFFSIKTQSRNCIISKFISELFRQQSNPRLDGYF